MFTLCPNMELHVHDQRMCGAAHIDPLKKKKTWSALHRNYYAAVICSLKPAVMVAFNNREDTKLHVVIV